MDAGAPRPEVEITQVDGLFAPVLAELHGRAFDGGGEAWSAAAIAGILATPGAAAWLAEIAGSADDAGEGRAAAGFVLVRIVGGPRNVGGE